MTDRVGLCRKCRHRPSPRAAAWRDPTWILDQRADANSLKVWALLAKPQPDAHAILSTALAQVGLRQQAAYRGGRLSVLVPMRTLSPIARGSGLLAPHGFA